MIPDAWSPLRGQPRRRPRYGGLINDTWVVGDPPAWVLQRLHPVFGPAVHEDIEAITTHLAARGLVTPRLVRTDTGALWAPDESGGVWRVLSYVPGRSFDRVESPVVAAEAGRLVGRFHRALDDLDWDYRHVRPGAHDTARHMALLQAAAEGADPECRALAEAILAAWGSWSGRLDLPGRHCHGDLKISNLRFDEQGHALCLLDLDTLAWMSVDVELGDAWRSWCNPVGEDAVETRFDLEMFAASARAYLSVAPLARDVREALVPGIERIALELASRFARDAVEDRYFGWNADRFPSRRAHNLFRARGQLALAASVRARRAEAEAVVLA